MKPKAYSFLLIAPLGWVLFSSMQPKAMNGQGTNSKCACKAATSIQADKDATKVYCSPNNPCVTVENFSFAADPTDGSCEQKNLKPPCSSSKCKFGDLKFEVRLIICGQNPNPCCEQASVNIGGVPIDQISPGGASKKYSRKVSDLDCGTNWQDLTLTVSCDPGEGGGLLYKRIAAIRCNLCPAGVLGIEK